VAVGKDLYLRDQIGSAVIIIIIIIAINLLIPEAIADQDQLLRLILKENGRRVRTQLQLEQCLHARSALHKQNVILHLLLPENLTLHLQVTTMAEEAVVAEATAVQVVVVHQEEETK
jgi:hypothetical protein